MLSKRHIVPFYAETVHLKDGVYDFLQARTAVCSKSLALEGQAGLDNWDDS